MAERKINPQPTSEVGTSIDTGSFHQKLEGDLSPELRSLLGKIRHTEINGPRTVKHHPRRKNGARS